METRTRKDVAVNIAQVGGSPEIATVHKDGSLWYYYSGAPYDAGYRSHPTEVYPPWNSQQVSGPNSASSTSIAQVGNSTVIAAVSADAGIWYYWQPIDGSGWNPEQVASPNTASSVSITQVGNSSVIVAVHKDGSLWYYWQTIGAKGWNPEQVSGPNTASSASIAQVGNSSVIAAVGADGGLWYYWQTIGAKGEPGTGGQSEYGLFSVDYTSGKLLGDRRCP